MKIRNFIKLVFAIHILIFLSCSFIGPDDHAGTGSETGNVVGVLYNPNGSKAANAKVYIIPVDHNPKPTERILAIDSTTTDDTGAFAVDSVPDGHYNILGDGDSGISYADSIFIDNDTIPTEVKDTLRNAGSLRGVVALQPGDDSRTVFILVFGTQTWTTPADSIGNFTLANMAEGTYHVRILTTLDDYGVLDTNLTIIAGIVDTSDTIYLPFTGIPIPTGLTLSYDKFRQIVTLTWNKCDTNLVKGYNVYRKHSDSDFVKINTVILTDTFFIDSAENGLITDETYTYKITSIDLNDNEGKKGAGLSVVIEKAIELLLLKDSLNIKNLFVDKNKYFYSVQYYNNKLEVFDSSFNLILEITDNLINPNLIVVDTNGNIFVSDNMKDIKKYNQSGTFIMEWSLPNWVYTIKQLRLNNKQNLVMLAQGNPNPKYLFYYNENGDIIDSLDLGILPDGYYNNDFDIGTDSSIAFNNGNHLIKVYNTGFELQSEWDVGFYIERIAMSPITGNISIERSVENIGNFLELYTSSGESIYSFLDNNNIGLITYSRNGDLYGITRSSENSKIWLIYLSK